VKENRLLAKLSDLLPVDPIGNLRPDRPIRLRRINEHVWLVARQGLNASWLAAGINTNRKLAVPLDNLPGTPGDRLRFLIALRLVQERLEVTYLVLQCCNQRCKVRLPHLLFRFRNFILLYRLIGSFLRHHSPHLLQCFKKWPGLSCKGLGAPAISVVVLKLRRVQDYHPGILPERSDLPHVFDQENDLLKIGRASCRERVYKSECAVT